MAKKLPTTTGNIVADIGKAVAGEVGTAMFNYLTEESKQKTIRTEIREDTNRYVAQIKGQTEVLKGELLGKYAFKQKLLDKYFNELDTHLANGNIDKYNEILEKIADLSTSSALAEYENQSKNKT